MAEQWEYCLAALKEPPTVANLAVLSATNSADLSELSSVASLVDEWVSLMVVTTVCCSVAHSVHPMVADSVVLTDVRMVGQ